jgi:hypothetical protein
MADIFKIKIINIPSGHFLTYDRNISISAAPL